MPARCRVSFAVHPFEGTVAVAPAVDGVPLADRAAEFERAMDLSPRADTAICSLSAFNMGEFDRYFLGTVSDRWLFRAHARRVLAWLPVRKRAAGRWSLGSVQTCSRWSLGSVQTCNRCFGTTSGSRIVPNGTTRSSDLSSSISIDTRRPLHNFISTCAHEAWNLISANGVLKTNSTADPTAECHPAQNRSQSHLTQVSKSAVTRI